MLHNNGLASGSTSLIENSYFRGNVSDKTGGTSGAMYAGVGVVQVEHTIRGCTFEDNSTTGRAGVIINQAGESTPYTAGGMTLEN